MHAPNRDRHCCVTPVSGVPRAWRLALGALVLAGGAGAQAASIYTCRDEHGRAYTSDRPIAECSRTALRELRRDGSLLREIAPPLTAEQLRQREIDLERKRIEDLAMREQQQRDRALLMAYPSEQKLEQARTRAVDALHREITEAQQKIVAHDRQMRAAQQQLDAARKAGAGTTDAARELARQVEASISAILAEDAIVQARREDADRVVARFEDDRQRLRQLLPPAVRSTPVNAPAR